MSKRTHLLAVCLALGVAAVAGEATAADGKWYPGIICTKDTTRGTWKRWQGTVYNNSTADGMDLTCPLVRDGTSISSASVQVWATSTAMDGIPSCDLHFEYASGNSVFGSADSQSVTTPSSPNVQTMTWGAQSVAGGDYYYGVCFLPKKSAAGASHIIRWGVTEP